MTSFSDVVSIIAASADLRRSLTKSVHQFRVELSYRSIFAVPPELHLRSSHVFYKHAVSHGSHRNRQRSISWTSGECHFLLAPWISLPVKFFIAWCRNASIQSLRPTTVFQNVQRQFKGVFSIFPHSSFVSGLVLSRILWVDSVSRYHEVCLRLKRLIPSLS